LTIDDAKESDPHGHGDRLFVCGFPSPGLAGARAAKAAVLNIQTEKKQKAGLIAT